MSAGDRGKRDILFLCQYFYPEYNSSATLPWDTAQYLAGRYKTVDALCGYPKEYSDLKNVPLREIKNGVHIRRVRYLQLNRRGRFGRLVNYFSFTAAAMLHIADLARYRCVIVYSNPPVLPVVAVIAKKLFHTRFVFVAYDIYPEVAYASHSLSPNGLIARAMRWMNAAIYGNADRIVALTEEMKEFILKNRTQADASRVCVISNWAHEECQKGEKNEKKINLQKNRFIVSYFGNMGICQDIETMLTAISILKDNPKISFLIAGHGTKQSYLIKNTKGCRNVKILDFLTGEDFEKALSVSSCGIVALEHGLSGMCAPSKYYSYLRSGCPILAVADENSYLVKEAEKEKIGYGFRVGEGERLAGVILKMSENTEGCEQMSERAEQLYRRKYAVSIAMKKYGEMIKQVLRET